MIAFTPPGNTLRSDMAEGAQHRLQGQRRTDELLSVMYPTHSDCGSHQRLAENTFLPLSTTDASPTACMGPAAGAPLDIGVSAEADEL